MSILERVSGPDDVKLLSIRELYRLAAEIRALIIKTVAVNGGHLASNLGVVELTLALHRVFSTPLDSIVWDVGHQCYAHKLVTGRFAAFPGLRKSGGLSGFPKNAESVHDAFEAGHASTSISAALGILAANERLASSNSVVAVIGDGALTGGMAWEAMSHAGQLGLPLIIVLNDNTMSISRNVGSVSSYLSRLSATVRYQRLRRILDRMILGVPFFGPSLLPLVLRLKRAVKAVFFKESLFADLGFEYAGPIDGHNIQLVCNVLEEARAIKKPVVVHVVTKKGKGHVPAEQNPSAFHGLSPALQPSTAGSLPLRAPLAGSAAAGLSTADLPSSDPLDPAGLPVPRRPTFTEAFGQAMLEEAALDSRVVAVVAAMSSGTGLTGFQRRFSSRFFDVGIAEAHAVTFAAGMAAGGLIPVVAIYSTFMQRAFDQVHHDVALAGRHVVFAVDRAGAVPDDGETHQGLYDVQAYHAVPGMSIIAPASAVEMSLALRWALAADGPVMIRYPKAVCPPERPAYAEPFAAGRGVFVRRSDVLAPILFAVSGALVEEALRAADTCGGGGLAADVYHLRFLKPFDDSAFVGIARRYRLVVIAEESVLTGSVAGELAASVNASMVQEINSTGIEPAHRTSVIALGFQEKPQSQAGRDALLERAGLSALKLAEKALAEMASVASYEAAVHESTKRTRSGA